MEKQKEWNEIAINEVLGISILLLFKIKDHFIKEKKKDKKKEG